MANLRDLKKEIDYRLEEFVFDCEMAIYFQPSKEEDASQRFAREEVLCCYAPRYGVIFR